MKKLLVAFLMITTGLQAQKTAGTIRYDYGQDWLKYIEKNKFMNNEQKQRALQTWKNDEVYKTGTQLTFNNEGSYYGTAADERGNSWQKTEYWVRRDFTGNKVLETQMIAGKVYIVEDSLYTFPWKIKSEIKEIAGHICMLATTYDSLRNYMVEAWFTTDIPLSIGPEEFMGLPGAILEVNINDGVVVLTATSVKLNENEVLPPLPKKVKGKRYSRKEYQTAVAKYIKDMEEARQMPWGLRY
ncbi:GLPGLI family protein [Leadbetterella sp. DM7]|uniref:GLPGLI family protein n=1 Tax=Leadbetterella sp. DM7 TaxID=3235085 RepID=UPI00349EE893